MSSLLGGQDLSLVAVEAMCTKGSPHIVLVTA